MVQIVKKVTDGVKQVGAAIVSTGKAIGKGIGDGAKAIGNFFVDIGKKIGGAIGDAWAALGKGVKRITGGKSA
jgi:hypothetical protein